jgi:hypothetical protein
LMKLWMKKEEMKLMKLWMKKEIHTE